jgi:hypothetical protein
MNALRRKKARMKQFCGKSIRKGTEKKAKLWILLTGRQDSWDKIPEENTDMVQTENHYVSQPFPVTIKGF